MTTENDLRAHLDNYLRLHTLSDGSHLPVMLSWKLVEALRAALAAHPEPTEAVIERMARGIAASDGESGIWDDPTYLDLQVEYRLEARAAYAAEHGTVAS